MVLVGCRGARVHPVRLCVAAAAGPRRLRPAAVSRHRQRPAADRRLHQWTVGRGGQAGRLHRSALPGAGRSGSGAGPAARDSRGLRARRRRGRRLRPARVARACWCRCRWLCWRARWRWSGGPPWPSAGTRWAAWCALLAAGLGTTEYAVYARTAMTEALSLPLAALSGLLLVLLVRVRGGPDGWRLGRDAWAADADAAGIPLPGGAIGLAGLVVAVWQRRLGLAMVAACLVAGATIAPWSVRNEALFGTVAPTSGYAGFILAQRMAYEAMTPAEWAAQWLYAMPGFGPAAARDRVAGRRRAARLAGASGHVLHGRQHHHGAGPCQNAPNPADQVGYLLRTYVWPHPVRFAAVTLVMAWKSLWVRKYFSLVAVPFFALMLWQAVRRRDLAAAGLRAAAAVRAGPARRHHGRHAALQPDAGARLRCRVRPGCRAVARTAVARRP